MEPEEIDKDLTGLSVPANNEYKNMSRDNLIKKALQLEAKNKQLTARLVFLEPYKQKTLKDPNPAKHERLFQQHKTKKFALKIAYVGVTYNGLTIQKGTENTIENYLFNAFYSLSLIKNREPGEDYTRAGRTDRGVSAFGNVIALHLRTNENKQAELGETDKISKPLDYLPKDIRILAMKEVDESFNARYSCIERQYKYFFVRNHLDLEAMRQAISYFVGNHNFRNFCRMDVVATTNYDRTIKKAQIVKVKHGKGFLDNDDRNQIYYFHFVGNSFLWHQIRFMSTILFLVGNRKQEPEIVQQLLSPLAFPKKPNYPISPQYPLILQDCRYPNTQFQIETPDAVSFYNTFNEILMDKLMEATIFANCVMMMKHWARETIGLTSQELVRSGFRQSEKYAINKVKKLAMHKTACISMQEAIDKLKGKRLELFEKRMQKQLQYEERVRQTNQNNGGNPNPVNDLMDE